MAPGVWRRSRHERDDVLPGAGEPHSANRDDGSPAVGRVRRLLAGGLLESADRRGATSQPVWRLPGAQDVPAREPARPAAVLDRQRTCGRAADGRAERQVLADRRRPMARGSRRWRHHRSHIDGARHVDEDRAAADRHRAAGARRPVLRREVPRRRPVLASREDGRCSGARGSRQNLPAWTRQLGGGVPASQHGVRRRPLRKRQDLRTWPVDRPAARDRRRHRTNGRTHCA